MENYQPTYFDWSEFDSKDVNGILVAGSGKAMMDRPFVMKLDELRRRYGKPLLVNSGFRFPEWNEKVSSTGKTGPHTTGKAVDLRAHGRDAHMLVQIAMELGFTGIGLQQASRIPHARRFVHLDTLTAVETKGIRPWIWSY